METQDRIRFEKPQLICEVDSWYRATKEEVEANREKNGGKIVMTTCLQRAGRKNQMGRIYPLELLQREFKAYQQFVDERSAHGECDHPDCLSENASILTSTGWKLLKDIAENEIILSLNTETGVIEEQQIEKKIAEHYKGKMIRIKGRNIDTMVTPNHRFWVLDRNGKGSFITASDLLQKRAEGSLTHSYIPKTGQWNGEPLEKYVLKGFDGLHSRAPGLLKEKYAKSVEMDSVVWFGFFGLWLAEGSATTGNGYKVEITQKQGLKADRIRELLIQFPSELKWTEKNRLGKITWTLSDARVWSVLNPIGKHYEKFIPVEMKKASAFLLNELFEYFMLGDGRDYATYNGDVRKNCKRKNVFSTSLQLLEDLHEVLIKIGGSGSITKEVCKRDYTFAGRIIKVENKRPLYVLNVSSTNGVYLHGNLLVAEEDYDGMVYCVRVKNGTFYCKHKASTGEENIGPSFWTGNSSVVSLSNVSHIITKQWWQDGDHGYKEWWGDIEVLNTNSGRQIQTLVEDGVKIGVSSRGVGTTTKSISEDAEIVQNNYVIICYDLVAHPSTHDAIPTLKEGIDISSLSLDVQKRYIENQIRMFVGIDLKKR